MVTVSIILPTYNRAPVISLFIDSLFTQSYTDWELIIVDDSSTDNTLSKAMEYVQKDQRISVHKLAQHKGLPGARNSGVALSKGQLIYFGEDDITFCDKDSLKTLIDAFFEIYSANKKIGAIGPRIKDDKGYRWLNSVGTVGPISKHFYHNFDFNPLQIVEVPSLHSCSIISKNAFLHVGGFDAKLYTGTFAKEEVDFYFRLRRGDYKIYYQPSSKIYHHRASLGGCGSSKKFKRYFYELRNSALFVARFNGILFSGLFLIMIPLRKLFGKRVF